MKFILHYIKPTFSQDSVGLYRTFRFCIEIRHSCYGNYISKCNPDDILILPADKICEKKNTFTLLSVTIATSFFNI